MKPGRAGEDEGHLPAPLVAEMDHAPGNEERGDHRAEVRAAVEDGRGQGALALREPLGDGLDRGGEVAGLADAEGAADGDVRRQQPPGEGIERSRRWTRDERNGQAQLGADPVDEPSGRNSDAGIDRGKRGGQIRIIAIRPAEASLEEALISADRITVFRNGRLMKTAPGASRPRELSFIT